MSTAEEAHEQAQSPEELRRNIEETREQLGDTVEALAEKTDVKAQAKRRITALQGTAREKRDQVTAKARAATPESANAGAQQVATAAKQNPLPLAAAGAFLVGFLFGRRRFNR